MLDDKPGQRLQTAAAEYCACRVVRMGQEDHFCLVSHCGLKSVHIELIVVRRIQRNGNCHTAEQLRIQEVARIAGIGDKHLIALIEEDGHCIKQAGI